MKPIRHGVKDAITDERYQGRTKEQDDLLNILKNRSETSTTNIDVQIIGAAGIGKTQFIRKFIRDQKDEFTNILVFDASNEITLKEEFIKIQNNLKKESKEKVFEVMKDSSGKSLIIFDNYESNFDINMYTCKYDKFYFVVISNSYCNSNHKQLEIPCLSLTESNELIRNLLGKSSNEYEEEAKQIAQKCEYIPILLTFVCDYINNKRSFPLSREYNLKQFLDSTQDSKTIKFDSTDKELLSKEDYVDKDYLYKLLERFFIFADTSQDDGDSGDEEPF